MSQTAEHRAAAKALLVEYFGDDAPENLDLLAQFPGGELEGEGAVSIFLCRAPRGGDGPESLFVVAGDTVPNYYPAWDLTPEQMYSVHLGTRFMLVLQVGLISLDDLGDDLESQILEIIHAVEPDQPIRDYRPVAAFRVEDQTHAVARLTVADVDVYVIGADAPPGIYQQTHLPPHVVYRLHLGNLIRQEAADERR
jgi:hypothetical protein